MSMKGYAKSVFIGILVALLLSFFEFFLVSWFPLSLWNLVAGALVVILPLLGIYLVGEGKKSSVIMLVLFVASASLLSWPLIDSFAVPSEHKVPRHKLPYEILLHSSPSSPELTEESRRHAEPTWKLASIIFSFKSASYHTYKPIWDFYEPEYYTVAYKEKNKSIEAVDFYYRGYLTVNPYYSVPQALHKKLTYGYATSIGGYEDYKDKLESHGFKVEETESGFTATNETTAVHCYLDGKHVVVAKTSKDKRHLLKSGER